MRIQRQEEIFKQAKQWVLEAGHMIRNNINEPLKIDTKSNRNDLVTSMDQQVERFFAKRIYDLYPNHFILAEEGYGDKLTSLDGYVWIIDPIDGTMNFVHQQRDFAISLAVYYNGIGYIGMIYDVMADQFYYGLRHQGSYKNGERLESLSENLSLKDSILSLNHTWLCKNRIVDEQKMQQLVRTIRGSRTYGSAALQFAYVAEGSIDGYLSMRLCPWDYAAGSILVNEVGGLTTDAFGQPLDLLGRSTTFTSNPAIQQRILNEYMIENKK